MKPVIKSNKWLLYLRMYILGSGFWSNIFHYFCMFPLLWEEPCFSRAWLAFHKIWISKLALNQPVPACYDHPIHPKVTACLQRLAVQGVSDPQCWLSCQHGPSANKLQTCKWDGLMCMSVFQSQELTAWYMAFRLRTKLWAASAVVNATCASAAPALETPATWTGKRAAFRNLF